MDKENDYLLEQLKYRNRSVQEKIQDSKTSEITTMKKKLAGYTLPKNDLEKIAKFKGKPCYQTRYMRLLRRHVRKEIQEKQRFKPLNGIKGDIVSTRKMVGKYLVYMSYWRGLVGIAFVEYDITKDFQACLAYVRNLAYSKTNYPN